MYHKEENLPENYTISMVLEVHAKQSTNDKNLSLSIYRILLKCKNEGRNLESEKSQDFTQKPQRNFTFMNSISEHAVSMAKIL